jgi:hypothetical protein
MGFSREAATETDWHELFAQAANDSTGERLRLLVADLHCPVLTSDNHLLSFQRLTEVCSEDSQTLAGKSFLKALTSSHTSRGSLESLASYGELLSRSLFPDSVRLTGMVIRVFATVGLSSRFGLAVDPSEFTASSDIQKLLAGTHQDLMPVADPPVAEQPPRDTKKGT